MIGQKLFFICGWFVLLVVLVDYVKTLSYLLGAMWTLVENYHGVAS